MRYFGLLVVVITAMFFQGETTSFIVSANSAQSLKFNPSLSPEYVAMLKQQAGARKAFYEEQAHSKSELRALHNKQKAELLERHRAARAKFSAEKHSRGERKEFFESQRHEMAELTSRQKEQLKDFDQASRQKVIQFRSQQNQERQALRDRLAHGSAAMPVSANSIR